MRRGNEGLHDTCSAAAVSTGMAGCAAVRAMYTLTVWVPTGGAHLWHTRSDATAVPLGHRSCSLEKPW